MTLHAETPGLRGTAAAARRRTRVRRAALREREELGGDPQRADGGTTGGSEGRPFWFVPPGALKVGLQ